MKKTITISLAFSLLISCFAAGIVHAALGVPQGYIYYPGTGNDLVSTTTWSGSMPADVVPVQRARAQTDNTGRLVWTYPTPYAADIIPIVSALPEDVTANASVDVKITSRSSTSTTFQVNKTTNVTVVAVTVLQLVPNPQMYLNLMAIQP